MKALFIWHAKRAIVYGPLFLVMSIYFYYSNANDLALALFVASLLLIMEYLAYRIIKKRWKKTVPGS